MEFAVLLIPEHQTKSVKYSSGMMHAITHRGPDSDGIHVDARGALGFRRLSIVDLHSGDQPIYNEDHTLAITFNGEIYNYQGLRRILIQEGHTFTTHTDTEVLLHGYEQWGTDLLYKIRGMFAFVIWNVQTGELFGARDRFGIKPLYYMHDGATFMYASEIKSLLRHPDFKKQVNANALRAYMTFQYPPLNETFFKGVFQLQPGHYCVFHNEQMDIRQWWDPEYTESKQSLSETVNGIDKEVIDSVDAHSIADVEVGAFLSSGVDSSYVAAVARPKHTYSIGFDTGKFDESKSAANFAGKLGLSNTARSIHASEAFEKFPQIIWHLDEPDSNPSCVPLYFLSELASRDVKVVLSGEGADELFCGVSDLWIHDTFKSHSRDYPNIGEITEKKFDTRLLTLSVISVSMAKCICMRTSRPLKSGSSVMPRYSMMTKLEHY